MTASDLISFTGRAVAVTYANGNVVRGRLSRTGASKFVLNPSVIAASGSWETGHDIDLANVVGIVEESAAFTG
ncbi:MAG: hypothetical protein IAI50_03900 [Candidatus Eremiobacteraeota bacterium]|nr:hypothetical protein [Candidatus Eremiobacteraeota bacterium]